MTTLAETTLKLINEVFGLAAYEGEIREIIGNTNWEVLALRTREARAAVSGPIDPKADGDEAFRQLLLIKHLAEYTTERNWADKSLYIMQAASRALSTTKPAQGDGELVRMRKALEPFSHVTRLFDHLSDDGDSVLVNLFLSDLREARAALAAQGDGAQEGEKTWGEWERKQQERDR